MQIFFVTGYVDHLDLHLRTHSDPTVRATELHTKLNRQDLVSDSRSFERTYADLGWRMGTVYDLTPELALYAQYSVAADPVGGMLLLRDRKSTRLNSCT